MKAIKVNELRIGNYLTTISEEPEFIKIDSIDSLECIVSGNGIQNIKLNELEQILITKEWLVNFGFEESIEIIDGIKNFDYYLEKNDIEFNCDWDLDGDLNHIFITGLSVEIKHVHQLQNVYFALTGEELKLKEKL